MIMIQSVQISQKYNSTINHRTINRKLSLNGSNFLKLIFQIFVD